MWVGERVGHTCKYLKYRVAQQRLCFGGGGGGEAIGWPLALGLRLFN